MVTVVPRPGSDTTSNSSIRRRAPGSPEPEPAVGAVAVPQGLLDVGDAGPGVPGHDPAHPARWLARPARPGPRRCSANRTMLRAISETAVAITVRSVPVKPSLRGQLPGLLPRGDDVGVRADRDARLVVAAGAGAPSAAGSARRRTRTPAGAAPRRPPAAAAGLRRTARAAPGGTGRSAARVCSSASRYSTRSRARVRFSWAATAPGVRAGSSASVRVSCAVHLVREQRARAPLGRQPGQRLCDSRLLLVAPAASRPAQRRP